MLKRRKNSGLGAICSMGWTAGLGNWRNRLTPAARVVVQTVQVRHRMGALPRSVYPSGIGTGRSVRAHPRPSVGESMSACPRAGCVMLRRLKCGAQRFCPLAVAHLTPHKFAATASAGTASSRGWRAIASLARARSSRRTSRARAPSLRGRSRRRRLSCRGKRAQTTRARC